MSKVIKKYSILITILAAWVAFSQPVHAQFVKTQGTQIVDEANNPLFISGINLGNWLLWEGYLMVGETRFMTHSQLFDGFKSAFGNDASKAKEFEQSKNHNQCQQNVCRRLCVGRNLS